MKRTKQLCMVIVLTLGLAVTTFAGEIHTGVTSSPPPPPQPASMAEPETVRAPDESQIGLVPSDLGTQIILNLLQMLSVY